jgi:hypothetical protein
MLRCLAVSLVLITGASAWAGCTGSDTVGPGFEALPGTGGSGGESGGSPSTSSASGSGPTGTASGSASSTGHGGGPSSSGSGGEACSDADPAEANETESAAHDLGGIDDCDGSGSSHQGVLGAADVDWYKYQGDDTPGCVTNPFREVTGTGAFRFCKYAQCDSGNPTFTCPDGTSPETSPDGRSGCCGADGFELGDLDCSGTDDGAWIYMRLDQPDPPCSAYTLAWHF